MNRKKWYEIKIVVFVTLSTLNNDFGNDVITFYIKGFNKHDAMFRLLKKRFSDVIVFEHNADVIKHNRPLTELWDGIIDYEIVDYLSIKKFE